MQDQSADDMLKALNDEKKGVAGYVIFNNDGIPIKRDAKNISYEKSVQYAALLTDLWNTTKRDIQATSKNADNTLELIRLRTKTGVELIVAQSGDYTMVCLQNCNLKTRDDKPVGLVQGDAPKV
mmetsp:Transcript_70233/g.81880  ORF Transcript_70233/g.81880 Transcript_70233/m.81880 type:complete len:124 (+) Transcript_70233:53-424(+)|eukprot:CAMPEP_0176424400 /NCGR_PEP_ID=MMETSP0127-20121128/10817_1 /TAXON_ID=938130 /ORGANISM="Platyophrya macrostoma, Strain WH" /LENGTH=123 /DNA_ID=CAMNT_0017805455 /DNA_START=42 /DNA_END=413 /DNA_ORIENTATION=-